MKSGKKGLGRGLSALFGDQAPKENTEVNQILNKVKKFFYNKHKKVHKSKETLYS